MESIQWATDYMNKLIAEHAMDGTQIYDVMKSKAAGGGNLGTAADQLKSLNSLLASGDDAIRKYRNNLSSGMYQGAGAQAAQASADKKAKASEDLSATLQKHVDTVSTAGEQYSFTSNALVPLTGSRPEVSGWAQAGHVASIGLWTSDKVGQQKTYDDSNNQNVRLYTNHGTMSGTTQSQAPTYSDSRYAATQVSGVADIVTPVQKPPVSAPHPKAGYVEPHVKTPISDPGKGSSTPPPEIPIVKKPVSAPVPVKKPVSAPVSTSVNEQTPVSLPEVPVHNTGDTSAAGVGSGGFTPAELAMLTGQDSVPGSGVGGGVPSAGGFGAVARESDGAAASNNRAATGSPLAAGGREGVANFSQQRPATATGASTPEGRAGQSGMPGGAPGSGARKKPEDQKHSDRFYLANSDIFDADIADAQSRAANGVAGAATPEEEAYWAQVAEAKRQRALDEQREQERKRREGER